MSSSVWKHLVPHSHHSSRAGVVTMHSIATKPQPLLRPRIRVNKKKLEMQYEACSQSDVIGRQWAVDRDTDRRIGMGRN